VPRLSPKPDFKELGRSEAASHKPSIPPRTLIPSSRADTTAPRATNRLYLDAQKYESVLTRNGTMIPQQILTAGTSRRALVDATTISSCKSRRSSKRFTGLSRSSCDVIETCTFRSNRLTMANTIYRRRFRRSTRAAELARRAADRFSAGRRTIRGGLVGAPATTVLVRP